MALNRNRVVMAVTALGAVLLAACSSGGTVTIADSQPANSQIADFQIAYVKRTVPVTNGVMAQDDLRLQTAYFTKANLFLLNPTASGSTEKNITARVTNNGNYDISDVDVSADGSRIIFAMRGPLKANQKNNIAPFWGLWEYVVASDDLHRLCPVVDPDCSGAQYRWPHYLPDGRILFSSTRQFNSGAVLLDEGKPEFQGQTEDLNESAFVLHVMNSDGTGIHQITFNQSHDIGATVLADGRLLFSRWDHANGTSGFNLYTANPDGTDVQLAYGFGSHTTASTNPAGAASCPAGQDCSVQFVQAREMEDGRVLALVRPFTDADFGGNIELIDTQHFAENNQAAPDTANNAGYSTTTVAEQSATQNNVLTQVNTAAGLPMISPGGRFSSAFPLWDGSGRILVTWSQCRLQNQAGTILPCTTANLADTTLTAAPVLYSAWMFDPSNNTYLPLTTPAEGVFYDDIVALQPRTSPPAYIPDSYNASTPPEGVVDIRSVYDWDGAACNGANGESCNVTAVGGIAGMAQTAADQRPARFLRIVKAVSIPDKTTLNFDQKTAFGSAGNYMREILGYVPIEPDGSVRVTVPAYVAFQLDIVSAQVDTTTGKPTGHLWRTFPLHKSWLQLLPGEEMDCNGCHLPAAQQRPPAGVSAYSHGRNDSTQGGSQGLFAPAWAGAASTAAFPGTTAGPAPCLVGQTMAEALYECGSTPANAATLDVNVNFTDAWFGGGPGNEPFMTALSYDDPGFAGIPLPTSQQCALPGGWNDDCRIVINYPTAAPATATAAVAGNIEPLWDKCRMADGTACAAGVTTGSGTCSGCHNASTNTTGYLDLMDGASANNANQENSYQQLMNAFSVTTTDPDTGQTTTTQVRGAELISGDAKDSHFFQVFTDPTNPDYAAHAGLLSPAELRLLSEWVDIGAQYFNNPFNAPTN
jgi:hypothetical protein